MNLTRNENEFENIYGEILVWTLAMSEFEQATGPREPSKVVPPHTYPGTTTSPLLRPVGSRKLGVPRGTKVCVEDDMALMVAGALMAVEECREWNAR